MEGYFDKEEFEYCVNEYKKEIDIVNICGVVLYSARNAHTNKVLKDKEFLNGLNEVSGKKVPVFYLADQGESSGLVCDNLWVMEMFQIRSTEDFPLLVLFKKNKDGTYSCMHVKLQDSNEAVFYNELCNLLDVVAKAVNRVDDNNFQCPDGVFSAVSHALTKYNQNKAMKSVFSDVYNLVNKMFVVDRIFPK